MDPRISDSDDDSGPELDDDELNDEISSTLSRISKSVSTTGAATVMLDETDGGEEVEVGFMSGRPGCYYTLDHFIITLQ